MSGGSKKEYLEKRISPDIEKIIQSKTVRIISDESAVHPITNDEGESLDYKSQVIVPIVSQGDPIGSIIFFSKDKEHTLGETELKAAEIAAHFLAKQMDN